jgi:hypothetical protein
MTEEVVVAAEVVAVDPRLRVWHLGLTSSCGARDVDSWLLLVQTAMNGHEEGLVGQRLHEHSNRPPEDGRGDRLVVLEDRIADLGDVLAARVRPYPWFSGELG